MPSYEETPKASTFLHILIQEGRISSGLIIQGLLGFVKIERNILRPPKTKAPWYSSGRTLFKLQILTFE
jgi:hypothetical protein